MSHRLVRVITRLNVGGPSIQAINLSRDLSGDGYDTLLVHGRLADGEGSMTELLSLDGLHTEYLDSLVRPVSPLADLRALWQLFWLMRRAKPDVIHTHLAKAGALGRLAGVLYNFTRGRAPRASLVHTYHGHVFDGYFGSPSTRVFLAVERWLGRRTDALIAISERVRHDLVSTYRVSDGGNVRIVPLGFDLSPLLAVDDDARVNARIALDIPADAQVVTTVGRLTAIKQHTLFLEAAAHVAAQRPHTCFLIVGDGELRSELEREAGARGLAERVRFLGWRADLPVIYGATDVFMLTSRNEGTPVALIEAMAAGVASVSTDVGGVRDVIRDETAGRLVPFGEAPRLAAATLAYLDDAPGRRRTGEAARAMVASTFDTRRLRRDIRSLYDELRRASVLQ